MSKKYKSLQDGTELQDLDSGTRIVIRKNRRYSVSNKFFTCCCLKLNYSIFFAYLYIITSGLLSYFLLVLFKRFKFHYTFSFLLTQQIFVCFFSTFVLPCFRNFKINVGCVSVQDFWELKFSYVVFSVIFVINTFCNLFGMHLINNVAIYYTFKNFGILMLFLYNLIVEKKEVNVYFVLSIFFILTGNVVSGFDCLSNELLGYIVILFNGIFGVAYNKFPENFNKRTGISNVKLIIYNSYIIQPILLLLIYITGEYREVFLYFSQERSFYFYLEFFSYLFMSCLLVVILLSSFVLSIEKNSSIYTILLSSSSDIIITFVSSVFLKESELTLKSFIGLILSTIGAVIVSFKSIVDGFLKQETEEVLLDDGNEDKNNNGENA